MASHEPIPETLARKYESFYREVCSVTDAASEGHAISTVKKWQTIAAAQDQQSADEINKKSEAVHNARHLHRIYELLGATCCDEAIDTIAELKKSRVDPAEISDLRSTASRASRDVHNILELLGVETVQEAQTRIYSLLRTEKLSAPASSSEPSS